MQFSLQQGCEISYKIHIMATAKLYADMRKKDKEGRYTVKVLVYHAGDERLFTLREYMTKKEWENIYTSKKHDEIYKRKRILAKLERAERIITHMGPNFSFIGFKKLFKSTDEHATRGSLQYLDELYERRINALEADNKFKTAKYYRSSLNALLSYCGPDIDLQGITTDMLKGFEKWSENKGNSIDTISTYLRPLRAIYNGAIRDGLIREESFPFGKGRYTIRKSESANSAFTEKQIEAFWKYKPMNDAQHRAKSYWFFSYLCNGIAPVDIANLTWGNIRDGFGVFHRQKTKQAKTVKTIRVPFNEHINTIVNSLGDQKSVYVFPILKMSMTAKQKFETVDKWKRLTNRVLNRLSKHIEPNQKFRINLYSARHTYANTLMRNHVPVAHISKGLGHSRLSTTDNYLGSLPDAVYKEHSDILTKLLPRDV